MREVARWGGTVGGRTPFCQGTGVGNSQHKVTPNASISFFFFSIVGAEVGGGRAVNSFFFFFCAHEWRRVPHVFFFFGMGHGFLSYNSCLRRRVVAVVVVCRVVVELSPFLLRREARWWVVYDERRGQALHLISSFFGAFGAVMSAAADQWTGNGVFLPFSVC